MSDNKRMTPEERSIERFESGDIIEAEEERPEEDRYFIVPSYGASDDDYHKDFYDFEDPLDPVEDTEEAVRHPGSEEVDIDKDEVPVLLYGWAFATQEMDFADLTGDLYLDMEDGEAVIRYELDSDIAAYSSGTSPEEIVTQAPKEEFGGDIVAGIDSKLGQDNMAVIIEASHNPESSQDTLKLVEYLAEIEKDLK